MEAVVGTDRRRGSGVAGPARPARGAGPPGGRARPRAAPRRGVHDARAAHGAVARRPRRAEAAVVVGGGAMGGLLGPADGFYQWLGEELGHARARASACCGSGGGGRTTSTSAPSTCSRPPTSPRAPGRRGVRHRRAQLRRRDRGAGRAWRWATGPGASSRSPRSPPGCEEAGGLTAPLLAFHGDRDEILPLVASQAVCAAGRAARTSWSCARAPATSSARPATCCARGCRPGSGTLAARYGLT